MRSAWCGKHDDYFEQQDNAVVVNYKRLNSAHRVPQGDHATVVTNLECSFRTLQAGGHVDILQAFRMHKGAVWESDVCHLCNLPCLQIHNRHSPWRNFIKQGKSDARIPRVSPIVRLIGVVPISLASHTECKTQGKTHLPYWMPGTASDLVDESRCTLRLPAVNICSNKHRIGFQSMHCFSGIHSASHLPFGLNCLLNHPLVVAEYLHKHTSVSPARTTNSSISSISLSGNLISKDEAKTDKLQSTLSHIV